MSEAFLPKTRPVQGSEWMILVRDYAFDVTANEFAVGSLYGTCGNWGELVYLSDVSVADILRIKRDTAATARKGLLAKGLIEDIGQHGTQPQQREYRLTVPVEMPPRRKVRGDVPEMGTPCPPNGHPDVPETGTGMSLDRAQHLEEDLEEDLELINITPGRARDDDGQQDGMGESQGSGPDRTDWDAIAPRDQLSSWLGVPTASIDAPLWRWLDSLGIRNDTEDVDAIEDAARRAVGKSSPVGYFQKILPGKLIQFRAKREKQAEETRLAEEREKRLATERAEHEAEAVAAWDEIESLIPVIGEAARHDQHNGFNWYSQEAGERTARSYVERCRAKYKGDMQKILFAVRREAEKARETRATWEAAVKDGQAA